MRKSARRVAEKIAAHEAHPLAYRGEDKYVARVFDHRGIELGAFTSHSRKEAMAWADAHFPSASSVSIRTDHTSDGRYWGPGGGRMVASRDYKGWIVDGGDGSTHFRAV